MVTTAASADGIFHAGSVLIVDKDIGDELVNGGFAIDLGGEPAVIKAGNRRQTAMLGPMETAETMGGK